MDRLEASIERAMGTSAPSRLNRLADLSRRQLAQCERNIAQHQSDCDITVRACREALEEAEITFDRERVRLTLLMARAEQEAEAAIAALRTEMEVAQESLNILERKATTRAAPMAESPRPRPVDLRGSSREQAAAAVILGEDGEVLKASIGEAVSVPIQVHRDIRG